MTKTSPAAELPRLQQAVRRLRPVEREILLLSAGEGLSNEVIAARLDISANAVERRLATALYKLDRELAPRARPWWAFWK